MMEKSLIIEKYEAKLQFMEMSIEKFKDTATESEAELMQELKRTFEQIIEDIKSIDDAKKE